VAKASVENAIKKTSPMAIQELFFVIIFICLLFVVFGFGFGFNRPDARNALASGR
jgi:ABC-type multidrug transport system permease subunit